MGAGAIWAAVERVKVLLAFVAESRSKFSDVLILLDSLFCRKASGAGGVGQRARSVP